MDNGYAVSMPVAYSIRPASTSFWGSRRLLTSDNKVDDVPIPDIYTYENDYDTINDEYIHEIIHLPLWNISSAPCSTLAMAYQHNEKLGILEEHEIKKCAYWRHVGKKIIRDFNFTSLRNIETFLVSIDDFSLALTHKNVLWDFVLRPHVLGYIMLMHPYFKPVRAIFIALTNLAEEVATYVDSVHPSNLNNSKRSGWKIDSESSFIAMLRKVHENELMYQNDPNISEYRRAVRRNYTSIPVNLVIRRNVSISPKRKKGKSVFNTSTSNQPQHGRRLLASISEMQAVQKYSADILSGVANPALSFQAAQSWVKGPYSWPPKYIYSYSTCPAAQVTVDALAQIFTVSKLYFENFDKPLAPVPKSLKDNFPSFNFYDVTINKTSSSTGTNKPSSIWASFYHTFLSSIKINEENVKYFFVGRQPWSLFWIIQTTLQCDFGGVMSCKNRTKDLFMSIFVFLLFYVVIYFLCSALNLQALSTMFFLSFPFFILWYTYGMSSFCLPMIPTCLMTDILDLLKKLLPLSIHLPKKLYCNVGDIAKYQNATDFTFSCVRSCDSIGFTDWYDPITFTVCTYDPLYCKKIVNGLSNITYINSLYISFKKWDDAHTYDQDNLDAYSFCTFIQWVYTLPFMFVLVLFSSIFSAIIYSLIAMIPTGINMVSQIIAFNHIE